MNRYIDANDFENAMYHEAFETDTEMQRWDSGCWIRYKLFENLLEKQPTADVAEVVHSEWKDGDCRCPVCGEDKFKGLDADIWADWKPNYCPNCGADMRGKK